MNPTDQQFSEQLQERFKELPKVVQDAITSAEIEKHLRDLADTRKLHLDQWQKLENEVMLTLLGFEQPEDLEKNIAKNIGISAEDSRILAAEVSTTIFEPIRQELERQLEHPDAQAKAVSGVEAAGAEVLATAHAATESATPTPTLPTTPAVIPATPPAAAPEVKVTRPSESSLYKPGQTSAQRAEVHDDPYREPPV